MTFRARQRRRLREELLAPLLVLVVILGLWWLGARLVSGEWGPSASSATPNHTESALTATPQATDTAAAVTPQPPAPSTVAIPGTDVRPEDLDALRSRRLRVPVEGLDASALTSTFRQERGEGTHEAMDIMAPRGTPVLAVEGGRIEKLFTSERGGLAIYQFDESESFCYYYAHLDRYAVQLTEGATVSSGDTIGFVGSTGNASPDAPHLHFAIFKLGPERRWWEGWPIDPYLVLR